MKTLKTETAALSKSKVAAVSALYAIAGLITVSGMFFTIYGIITNTAFQVFGVNVPGYVFGLCVAYLGVRNYLSVRKLRVEVYKKSSKFSWDNFKKSKAEKSCIR